jgi:hypothetical protein
MSDKPLRFGLEDLPLGFDLSDLREAPGPAPFEHKMAKMSAELERLRSIVSAAAPFVAMIAQAADESAGDEDVLWDDVHPYGAEARAAAALTPLIAGYDPDPMRGREQKYCRWGCRGHYEGDPYIWHHAAGCPWLRATQEQKP